MRLVQSERFVERKPVRSETKVDLPAVWSSAQWLVYFRTNAERLLCVPWDTGAGLTPAEREVIAGSLPSWQLGETSDGSRLIAAARHHAAKTGDPDFVEVIRLFIGEEQRHGEELGRFLDLAGVQRKTWDWGDAVFRIFRHLLTRIEVSAAVLITVEVHALVYYNAIRRATGSRVLRQICRQILRDEVPHVRFQCERLAILHRHRPRVLRGHAGRPPRAVRGGHAGDLGRAPAGSQGRRVFVLALLADGVEEDGTCLERDGPASLQLAGSFEVTLTDRYRPSTCGWRGCRRGLFACAELASMRVPCSSRQ